MKKWILVLTLSLVGCSEQTSSDPVKELNLTENADFLDMQVQLEQMDSKISDLESEVQSLKAENEELRSSNEDLSYQVDDIIFF
jgi:TolA-binding protein